MTTKKRASGSGWHVNGQRCPRCGHESVVYNGNYYCDREQECGWVMKESHTVKRIVVAYLRQCWHEAKEKGDTSEMSRMEGYLRDYGEVPEPDVFAPAPLDAEADRLARYGKTIWETSRADEGTISVTGANHVARAVIAVADEEQALMQRKIDQLISDLAHCRSAGEAYKRLYDGQRKATATAWGHWLKLAIDSRFDDGTPVLEWVFAHDPELAARAKAVFGPGGPHVD